jgi:hypothetical protein
VKRRGHLSSVDLLGNLEELGLISEEDESSNASILAASSNMFSCQHIPASTSPKRPAKPKGLRRGPYATRVAKIVKRLQAIHPDLSENILTDYVRRSFIQDISDSQYFGEASYHVDWALAGSIPRDGYVPPKVSHIV